MFIAIPSISWAAGAGCPDIVKTTNEGKQRANTLTSNYVPPAVSGSCNADTSEDPKHPGTKRITVHVVPLYYPIQNQDPHGLPIQCDVYLDYETELVSIQKTPVARWVIANAIPGDRWDYRFADVGVAAAASTVESRSNEKSFGPGALDYEQKVGDRHAFAVPIANQKGEVRRTTYYSITVTAFDEKGQLKGPCFIRDPIIVNQD